jgi:hypothetical protein
VLVADGQQKPPKRRRLRPSAPHLDGPLASSGAAPEAGPEAAPEAGPETASTTSSGATPEAGPATAPATGSGATAEAGPGAAREDAVRPGDAPAGQGEEPRPAGTSDRPAETGSRPAVDPTGDGEDATAVGPDAARNRRESDAGTSPDAGREVAGEPGTSGLSTSAPDTNGSETSKAAAASSTPESGTDGLKPGEPGAGGKAAPRNADEPETTGGPGDGAAAADKTPGGSATAEATDKSAGKTPEKPSGKDRPGEQPEAKADGKAGDKAGDKADGKAGDKADGKAGDSGEKDEAAPSAAALAAASKGRATRVLRSANPVRVARNTARSTSAWAKRPSGRLIVPAVIGLLLLGGAGAAGAYLVPRALQSVPSPAATPGFGADGAASGAAAPSGGGAPGLPGSASAPAVGGIPPAPPVGGVGAARPADALSGWAQQTGTRAGIPVVAVQAYGYAELVVGRTTPACHLSWTTIAAIAKVESAHGSANGAVLSVDGSVAPAILGLPLDGKGGRQLVRDSDQGLLDGDTQFDRALGPLQFIPQTWAAISVGNGADADNNGVSDPNDIDDASLAAARYLCQNGRDLSKPDAWWDAILSYNAVRPYAQKVFDAANDYGQRSKV